MTGTQQTRRQVGQTAARATYRRSTRSLPGAAFAPAMMVIVGARMLHNEAVRLFSN